MVGVHRPRVSPAEFGRRRLAVARLCEALDLSAIVGFASKDLRGHVRYLTGFEPWCAPGEWAVSVLDSHDGSTSLLTNAAWDFIGDGQVADPDVEVLLGNDWQQSLGDVLGSAPRRVGVVDPGRVPSEIRDAITRAWGQTLIVDVTDDIATMRAVKSQDEVEILDEVNRLAHRAISEIRSLVQPGTTELRIAGILDGILGESEIDGLVYPTNVMSGRRTSLVCARPTNKELVAGEILQIDCSPSVDGYMADVATVIPVGDASEPSANLIEASMRTHSAVAARLAPGVTAATLHQAAITALESMDLSEADLFVSYNSNSTFVGHGIGLANPDPPGLITGDSVIQLAKGMVINVEPIVLLASAGSARMESAFVIEDAGARLLGDPGVV